MSDRAAMTLAQALELRGQCTRFLNHHCPPRSMAESLRQLLEMPEAALPADTYGEGEVIQALEARVAALLGKESALFFHKGVAAQLAALRVWTDGASRPRVALHAQSHIDADEAQAYEELLGLHGQRVGVPNEPFTVDDLAALPERPSAVVVELPLRRGGFVLPSWDGLQSISSWCRAQRVPLHFDGARLWESCPGYGRSLAEVAALADSVYVSFYKGLGGLGGCVLAGSADFIERVKPWKNRLAGNLYTVFPFVLSAQAGLDRHLPRMPEYHARAMALAQALSELGGVTVYPQVPGTNAFQLHLAGDRERLQQGLVEIARTRRFWLGWRLSRSFLPGCSMMEISIGDAADGWHDDEVVEAMDGVLRQSRHV